MSRKKYKIIRTACIKFIDQARALIKIEKRYSSITKTQQRADI